MNERQEHHVEFVEPGEDAPEDLESAEQPLDLIAPPVRPAGDPMGALGVADGLNGFECPGNALALILD